MSAQIHAEPYSLKPVCLAAIVGRKIGKMDSTPAYWERCKIRNGVTSAVALALTVSATVFGAETNPPAGPHRTSGQDSSANATNSNLIFFQDFVNGNIPIKEAIVYRNIAKLDGTWMNEEWWRFGCQDNTYYVQRLEPDKETVQKLV